MLKSGVGIFNSPPDRDESKRYGRPDEMGLPTSSTSICGSFIDHLGARRNAM